MSEKLTGELECFVFAELTECAAIHGGAAVPSKLGFSMQLFSLPEGDRKRSVLLSGTRWSYGIRSHPGECKSVRK